MSTTVLPVSYITPLPDVAHRTLPAAFDRVLADIPDATLLESADGTYSYAEAHERSLRIAGGLRALGVGSGDRVLLMLDNSADAALAWFATALTRVAEVPVNTAYKGSFLSHVVNDCGAAVAIVEQAYCARFAAVASELQHLRTVVVRGGDGRELAGTGLAVVPFAQLGAATAVAPEIVGPGDLLAISDTSGTTGRSKGVRVPHAQAFTYSHWDETLLGPGTTTLVTLPMFHLSGQWFGLYQGYHNLPEQTLRTFRNLWLHTGDAFSRDENGEFFFRDRIKDALRRRGENISSFEVESVVNGHPAIAESAVVAVPSELTEDDLKVVVVLRPGASLDPAELIAYLAPRMPYFTVPRYVQIIDELPKTPTQKVQKAVLRDAGLAGGTWDREEHGVAVSRD